MRKQKKVTRVRNPYSFILAIFLGMVLAVSGSVWATTIGDSISATKDITAEGILTINSSTASSSITHALGIATTTPMARLSIQATAGPALLAIGSSASTTLFVKESSVGIGTTSPIGDLFIYNSVTPHLYIEGTHTTASDADVRFRRSRAGAAVQSGDSLGALDFWGWDGSNWIESGGFVSFAEGTISAGTVPSNLRFRTMSDSGDFAERMRIDAAGFFGIGTTSPAQRLSVAGNLWLDANYIYVGSSTAASTTVVYQGTATTSIATNADSFAYATSSANIPLVKFDSSNTRVGISTTTPGRTLSVGGDGTALIEGAGTSTLYMYSTGPITGTGARGGCIELEGPDGSAFRLYATSAQVAMFESGSCR